MRRAWILLSCMALSFGAQAETSVTPATFVKPGFPRLAVDWTGPDQNLEDASVQQLVARGSVAMIGTWPGWQNGHGMTLNQAVQAIKAINPSILVFQYINNMEINTSDSEYAPVISKLNTMHWYLYPSGTSGTPVPANSSGDTAINNTTWPAKDSSGYDWVQWYAHWAYNTYYVPNPSLDGFITDNVELTPDVAGDWSLSGTSDSTSNPNSSLWEQEGYLQHFATLNALMPGKFQIGNVAQWGNPKSNLSRVNGMLVGGVMEAVIGQTWSIESWAGWQGLMTYVAKTMAAFAQPQLGIFSAYGQVTDYQGFRYALTSCMMTDAYLAYNALSGTSENNSSNPWFDEYAWQGKLGPATTSTPTAAWQKGVYRRDFQGGIALVNPKGNGPQTVTLETTYTRLSSTCPTCQNQAPTVNSGQPVTTLTLQDRDGIVLLRTTPQAVPDAPTLTVN
jgi:hypothetical protein